MSVIVKGMKMPECCDVCMFSDWSNLHQTASCKIRGYEPCFEDFSREYTSKRSNNCPLTELPEKHGRLIDGDVFFRHMNTAIAMMYGMMKAIGAEDDEGMQMELKAYRDIRDGIKDYDTVIEAEG